MGRRPSKRLPRNTTVRDRHRAIIRRDQPPCHICKRPIDYSLPFLDPWAYTVDHVIPLAKGGPDTLENKRAAHRTCNRTKSDRLGPIKGPIESISTERAW